MHFFFRPSLLILAAALATMPTASAQVTDPNANTRRVTVMRNVRESVTPDRVTVVLGAEAVFADPADAGTRLATLERAITDTLRKLGIPATAISITPMGVNVLRQQGSNQTGLPQHAAQSLVRVSLDRTDRLMAVTHAAISKGGIHVNAPTFEIAAEDSIRRVLVQRALDGARRDAEAIARSMGGRLGQMLDVTQSTGQILGGFPEMVVFPSTAQFAGFNGRQPTSATVSASVTVRWAFVEGG